MNKSRILELFTKYLSRTSSESEEQEFWGYVEDPLCKRQIQEILSDTFENQTEITGLSEISRRRILNKILYENQTKSKKENKLYIRIGLSVAATVALCLGIMFYLNQSGEKVDEKTLIAKKDVVKADSSKAYLTLSDGKRVALSDIDNGQVAMQSGIIVTKTADGELIYSISDRNGEEALGQYNTVETPRGGQYQINLPDGTKVWLNAASSLRYPVSFSMQKERSVTLKGEGYFEVAKDKSKPFIVIADRQKVAVLGTHFNIDAYQTQRIRTTLLEGAVEVSSLAKNESSLWAKVLKPGQMSINEGDKITVSDAPYIYDEIAWKDGYFVFNNANIKDIMEDLSNWYDLEVEYQGDMSDIYFQGNYLRSRSVMKLLKSIELTSKVSFKIEGRRITVIAESKK